MPGLGRQNGVVLRRGFPAAEVKSSPVAPLAVFTAPQPQPSWVLTCVKQPLHCFHSLCRVLEEVVLFLGACVGYYSGDTRKLLEDCATLKPTVFAGVPRVYERIYSGVTDKVSYLPAKSKLS